MVYPSNWGMVVFDSAEKEKAPNDPSGPPAHDGANNKARNFRRTQNCLYPSLRQAQLAFQEIFAERHRPGLAGEWYSAGILREY
jgi:hypothetical protein